MTNPLELPPPRPSAAVRVMTSGFTVAIGLVLLGVGILVMVLTVLHTQHDDKQLFVGAGLAVFGALIVSPVAVGGALTKLGLAIGQVWPGGRRASDPEAKP